MRDTQARGTRKVPCSCGHSKFSHGYPENQPCTECACLSFDWAHVIEVWCERQGLDLDAE